MKNILYTIIFSFLFSSACWAQWVYVFSSENGDRFFLDPLSIQKKNGAVYVYEMTSNSKPRPYWSSVELKEYDCDGIPIKYRQLSITFYSKQNGEGKVLGIYNEKGDWQYLRPNTYGDLLFRLVCKKGF